MREGERIAAAAQGWVGTPFHWEASVKGVGADCRGLLSGVARECGRREAETFEALVVGYSRRIPCEALIAGLDRLFDRVAMAETAPRLLEPGDILAFRIQKKVQHLAIYTGDGTSHRMVHAYSGDPAKVVSIALGGFWLSRLFGAWRWRDGD